MAIKTISIIALLFLAAFTLRSGHILGESAQTQANGPGAAVPVLQSRTDTPPKISATLFGSDDIDMFKLAGDGQEASTGQWTPAPLGGGVWRESDPKPLINMPVDFSLTGATSLLAGIPSDAAPPLPA